MRIGDFLNLYRLSTGSMLYCLNETKKLMNGVNNPTLTQRVDDAHAASVAARDLELQWRVGKRDMPMLRKGAAEIDAQIDRTLSSLLQMVQLTTNLLDNSTKQARATELMSALFSEGVFPITSLKYEDQHAAVDALLAGLKGAFANHVTVLHLDDYVAQLERLNAEFADRISILNHQKGVSFDQVDAARRQAEEAFHRVIVQILSDYMDDDATRAQLFRPLSDQNERARTYYKRRGRTPQIDPDTGVVVDDEHEGDISAGAPPTAGDTNLEA